MHSPTPLVSCIMPTANRPQFVPLAIRRFLEQDYPRKELVIVDDGQMGVEHLVPDHPEIFYHRHPGGISLGEKRNWAVRQSRGNYILHWDDDDWTARNWISQQMGHLLDTGADVTGLEVVHFLNPEEQRAWKYIYPQNQPQWVHGATLCYTRQLWEKNPFPPMNVGEDCQFLWSEMTKKIVPHGGIALFVGIIHGKNASPKKVKDSRWQTMPAEGLIRGMGKMYPSIREAAVGKNGDGNRDWR